MPSGRTCRNRPGRVGGGGRTRRVREPAARDGRGTGHRDHADRQQVGEQELLTDGDDALVERCRLGRRTHAVRCGEAGCRRRRRRRRHGRAGDAGDDRRGDGCLDDLRGAPVMAREQHRAGNVTPRGTGRGGRSVGPARSVQGMDVVWNARSPSPIRGRVPSWQHARARGRWRSARPMERRERARGDRAVSGQACLRSPPPMSGSPLVVPGGFAQPALDGLRALAVIAVVVPRRVHLDERRLRRRLGLLHAVGP